MLFGLGRLHAAALVRRFNVYVTQPEIKPGCILRRSNYNVLEGRKLVSRKEVRARFGWVGMQARWLKRRSAQ